MPRKFEGVLDGRGKRFAIIVSRFNEAISVRLLEGAMDCLKRHNTADGNIDIFWVPGSFEIPLVARRVAQQRMHDAVICLGALIRGDTPHFDYIASEVTKGVARIMYETDVPAVFGVITADSMDQAIERAGGKAGNKGWQAALSALEIADLFSKLKKSKLK